MGPNSVWTFFKITVTDLLISLVHENSSYLARTNATVQIAEYWLCIIQSA